MDHNSNPNSFFPIDQHALNNSTGTVGHHDQGDGHLYNTYNNVQHGQQQGLGLRYNLNSNVIDNRFHDAPEAQTRRGGEEGRVAEVSMQMGEAHRLLGQGGTHSPHLNEQQAPSFFQGGPAPQHAPAYTFFANMGNQAFPRQPSMTAGGPYNGLATGQLGVSWTVDQERQYHGHTRMNENNARTHLIRPFPSHIIQPTPMLNQPMHNAVGYRDASHHFSRQQQPFQSPSSPRYAPYPRRIVQPSTATTFVGARSFETLAKQDASSAMNMQGLASRHAPLYSNVPNAHFHPHQTMPQPYPNNLGRNVFHPAQFQPTYPPSFAPHQPSPPPALYPGQPIGHHLGQGQALLQGCPPPNAPQSAWMPSHFQEDNGNYPARNRSFEGATWQVPAQGQFGTSGAPLTQVYEGNTHFNVSDPSHGESETSQKHVFSQLTNTGNWISSGHHPMERFQHSSGLTSQSPLAQFGNREPNVQVFEENMRTTNMVEDHAMASANSGDTVYPVSTSEEQKTITHQQFEFHDHNVSGLVIPSAAAHSDEEENSDEDAGSQSDRGEVQGLTRAPSPASQVSSPSPEEDDRGDSEDNGQENEEEVSEGEGKEEKEEEEEEQMEEDEKMVMCKMAIQPGWFMYVFLRPDNNFFVYHG